MSMAMGSCCLSPENREKRKKTKEIDAILAKERNMLKREIKLLLLGE
jgi:hypothetical protein